MEKPTIEIGGELNKKGNIEGNGFLSFEYDPVKTKLLFDYSKEDLLKISLNSTVKFNLEKDVNLSISGTIDYLKSTNIFSGKGEITLNLPKNVSVQIAHTFNDKPTFSAKLTLQFK